MLIVDAGGGTIDINAYAQTPAKKGYSFAEVATSQCKTGPRSTLSNFVLNSIAGHFQGSVFVTQRAQAFVDGNYLRSNRMQG